MTPCQTAVFTQLQQLNNGLLALIVQKFGGTATGYNWRLLNGTLPTGTYGSTSPYNKTNKSVTTTFDSNHWRNASDLSLARTMLHEAVHAYLVTYFANNYLYAQASYPALVDAWNAQGTGVDAGIVHHNEMGQGWIGDLAWALKQYGQSQGYNLADQFYSDMAWGGLEGSQAFVSLSQADKDRISKLLRVELTGEDGNGNTQTQSGRSANCP